MPLSEGQFLPMVRKMFFDGTGAKLPSDLLVLVFFFAIISLLRDKNKGFLLPSR